MYATDEKTQQFIRKRSHEAAELSLYETASVGGHTGGAQLQKLWLCVFITHILLLMKKIRITNEAYWQQRQTRDKKKMYKS